MKTVANSSRFYRFKFIGTLQMFHLWVKLENALGNIPIEIRALLYRKKIGNLYADMFSAFAAIYNA
jgi:hypothetical protein